MSSTLGGTSRRALTRRIGVLAVFAMVLAMLGLATAGSASADTLAHITGTVTASDGSGVGNVSVTATDPGGATTLFGPSTTATNGSYELDVTPGIYDVHFEGQSGSGLSPVVQSNFSAMSDQVLSVQLLPAPAYTVTGVLRDTSGNPLSNWSVLIGSGQATTAADGSYTLQTTSGDNIRLSHYQTGNNQPVGNLALGSTSITSNQTLNLTLPFTSTTIHVVGSDGHPVTSGYINVINSTNVSFAGPFGTATGTVGTSTLDVNSQGTAVMQSLPGTRPGPTAIYYDTVGGSYEFNLPSTVNGPETLTLNLPQAYTVTGVLRDTSGNPLSNWSVLIGSGQATTAADGSYTLQTTSGDNIRLSHYQTGNNQPVGNLALGSTSITSNQTLNLTLPFTSTTIHVVGSDGHPVTSGYINVINSTNVSFAGPFGTATGTVGTSTLDVNSQGTAVMQSLPGTRPGPTAIYYDTVGGSYEFNLPSTVNGPETLTLNLPQAYTVTGVLRDTSGNPLSNWSVLIGSGQATTAADGSYTLQTTSGDNIRLSHYQTGNNQPVGNLALGSTSITSNQTLNLTLPFTSTTIHVVGSDGHPVTSGYINVINSTNVSFAGPFGTATGTVGTSTLDVNSQGTAVMQSLPGTRPGPTAIYYDTVGGSYEFNLPSTVNGPETLLLEIGVGIVSDTTPPVVQSVSYTPPSVDVSHGPADVQVSVAATDDISGISYALVNITDPTHTYNLTAGLHPSSGTPLNGTLTGTVTIPAAAPAGGWVLNYLEIHDAAGNVKLYTQSEIDALGVAPINVTSAVDSTPPEIQSASYTPSTVDISNGPAIISATVTATDDLSGVEYVQLGFVDPTDRISLAFDMTRSSGTPLNGTFTGRAEIERYSPPGLWTLNYLCVHDYVGNVRCYTDSEMRAFGLVPIIVTADSSPPVVTGNQSPAANSAGWNNSAVTVNWTATDDSGSATTPAASVISTEGANQSVTSGTSCDPSGNCATGTYSGINIDTTAPTTTVTGVVGGSTYANNAAPTPSCSDSDALSGVATSSTVSVTHTGTAYTATCSGAVDNAGNAAGPVSVHYTVNNPAGYTTVNVSNSSGAGLAGVPVTFRPVSGTSTSVTTGTDGSASTVLTPGTYTVTATYANGSTSKQLTVTANGPNSVSFATLAVTVNVVDPVAADIASTTVAQAGNSGTFGSPVAVNSSGVATFEVLPGTSSFTARVAGGYQTQSLNVTAGGANTVTFTTTSVTVNIADPVAADLAVATVAHAGNSGSFGPQVAVDSSGNVTFQALPGTSTFTARVAGGYQTKTMTVVAGNTNTIGFATVGVTITVVDGQGNLLTNATVSHAGNTGIFGPRVAVNSTTAQVTFQALPGTSTFTAWNAAGTKYKSATLTVTGSTTATITVS